MSLCAQCEKPADLKCANCKAVAYCCKDHQKAHWKTHKSTCQAYEIKTAPNIGKYLVATRDLSPEDIILSEEPFVIGPRHHSIETGPVPCPGCCRLIIAKNSPRCDGCDWPVCNTLCDGLVDPMRHGLECFILSLRKQNGAKDLHEFYRQDNLLPLRCLLVQRQGLKRWAKLMSMEAHMDKRKEGTDVYKEIDQRCVAFLRPFLDTVKAMEQTSGQTLLPDVSSATLHKICGILDVNALEISQDGEMSALYPTAYLMQHSCLCNTVHAFASSENNCKLTVRAAVAIKKGESITTMYTHALWGTQARREHLQQTKYFSCNCQRCADPTELGTHLSALKCMGVEGQPCDGYQLPLDSLNDDSEWACSKCEVRLTASDAANLVNQIGNDVDAMQISNPTVRDFDGLLEKLLTFLHPNHYHVYSVKHSLVQLYGYQQGYLANQITDELVKRKMQMCRELIKVTETIDPGNSRLCLYSGVLYHELHMAIMILVKRKWDVGIKKDLIILIREAQESIVKAAQALKFETTSASGEKLNQLILTTHKDFDKWIKRYKVVIDCNYDQ